LIALTRRQRRRRALAQPFPPAWRDLLSRRLVHWNLLDAPERSRLEDLIRVFLAQKKWESANGLVLTDEIRVLISAMACLLVLGRDDDDPYRGVTWIEVQPTTMVSRGPRRFAAAGVVSDAELPIVGETSFTGPVFIAWDAAREGARHPERGHNVVYHEFAHQLDMDDGTVDGTPMLDPSERRRWIDVCTTVYEAVRDGRAGELLDPYAGVNPGEFFAVATEVFFDRPVDLEHQHRDLYDVLRGFYRQDPAARARRAG
jgi:MtfA peptidase